MTLMVMIITDLFYIEYFFIRHNKSIEKHSLTNT